MEKYRELVTLAMEKGSQEESLKIMDKAVAELRKRCPDMYEEIMDELECLAYRIPTEDAMKIVRSMKPKGQNWSVQQVRDLLRSRSVNGDTVNWYLVMNMCYNDYYCTAKMFNLQNDEDFYFSLARDFINDPDAKPLKVEKYFLD